MRPTVWQRLDSFSRHLVPLTLTLLLVILAVIPTHAPGLVRIGPMLSLISVYYWTVHRPDLMGYGTAFTVGLLEDMLSGTPLGPGALSLLLTQAIVVSQYRFFNAKPFVATWWAFGLVAAGAAAVKWLMVSAVVGVLAEPEAPFYAYLMTVAFYPVVAWALARAQIVFLRDV